MSNIPILGTPPKTLKSLISPKIRKVKCPLLCGKQIWYTQTYFQCHIEISRHVEYSTGPILGGPTNENTQKIDFFKIT